jgi:ISXO2-like transposase domain/Family of unknown function (DUF5681)
MPPGKTAPTHLRGFQKGQSGNPAGRAQGSRTKSTLFAEAILENDREGIMDAVAAKNGDPRSRIANGTIVNADEGSSWDALHATYEMKRINHEEAYSLDGACTNWAEEFFSRMRRAEAGHHHHIAGPYLLRYAQESSWREDHRRISNGEQVDMVSGLAMKRGPSVDFSGYWQRHSPGH